MEETLLHEIIVSVGVWRAEDGYNLAVVVDQRSIDGPVAIAVNFFLHDVESLATASDALERLCLHAASQYSAFEDLR